MKKLSLFLLSLILISILRSAALPQRSPRPLPLRSPPTSRWSPSRQSLPPPPKNVNQMHFVFRWPETYCRSTGVRCAPFPPRKFTLLGFRGTTADGDPYANCVDNQKSGWADTVFNAERTEKLNKFWPALLANQNSKQMWENAWVKYGTCSVSRYDTPTRYFNRVIALDEKMKELLKDHLIKNDGIVPCDSMRYTNKQVSDAFNRAANGRNVHFTCTNEGYLKEVTFCFTNKDYSHCPPALISKNCLSANIIIPLPPIPTATAI